MSGAISNDAVGRPSTRTDARVVACGVDVGTLAACSMFLGVDVVSASSASDLLRRSALDAPDIALLARRREGDNVAACASALLRVAPACQVVILTDDGVGGETWPRSPAGSPWVLRAATPCSALLKLVGDLLAARGRAVTPPPTSGPLQRTIDYLATHHAARFRMADLCAVVHLSAGHLGSLVRQAVGCSLHELRLRMRLEVARRLLVTTDDRLDDIAVATGFTDASHLSRAFAHAYQERPGEFRRHARGALRR